MFAHDPTHKTILMKVLFTLGITTFLYLCLSNELYAASSENYILDSATIGQTGTIEAFSTNYRTNNTGQPIFYQGETLEIADSGGGGNGGGGHHVSIAPREMDSYIYTTTAPLILKDFQSGTLFLEHQNPTEFVTLYISPYATAPKNTVPESATMYHSGTVVPSPENIPPGIDLTDLIGGHLYEIVVARNEVPQTILQKYLTLIIENPSLTDTTPGAYTVYYLHPVYNVWIQVPHPAFIEGAVIFQTPYATRYMIVKNSMAYKVTGIIRTPQTPENISDETIQNDIRDTEGQTTRNELNDSTDTELKSDVQNDAPNIKSQTFLDFLRTKYAQYFIPLIAGLFIFLLIVLFIYQRNASK